MVPQYFRGTYRTGTRTYQYRYPHLPVPVAASTKILVSVPGSTSTGVNLYSYWVLSCWYQVLKSGTRYFPAGSIYNIVVDNNTYQVPNGTSVLSRYLNPSTGTRIYQYRYPHLINLVPVLNLGYKYFCLYIVMLPQPDITFYPFQPSGQYLCNAIQRSTVRPLYMSFFLVHVIFSSFFMPLPQAFLSVSEKFRLRRKI